MAKHVISVCIFCFLCATHTPCESHAEVTGHTHNREFRTPYKDPSKSPPLIPDGEVNRASEENYNNDRTATGSVVVTKRDVVAVDRINGSNKAHTKLNVEYYLRELFVKYGDGKTMTLDGFERLMRRLQLGQRLLVDEDEHVEASSDHQNRTHCLHKDEIFSHLNTSSPSPQRSNVLIDEDEFRLACPAVIYSMVAGNCPQRETAYLKDASHVHHSPQLSVWLYSNLAVLLISACGILGLAVIPVMHKKFYQPLLQFLVALAVGTLGGDALLHLLPHAMSQSSHVHHEHGHEHGANEHENMWKGFVAMLGLVFFFFMERIITIVAKWRRRQQIKDKLPKRLKVMNNQGSTQLTNASEKQCKHKYSSFPYCYDEIKMLDGPNDEHLFRLAGGADSTESHNNTATTTFDDLGSNSDVHSYKNAAAHLSNHKLEEANQNMTECPNDITNVACTEINKMLATDNHKDESDSVEYTVILREHENRHHGHSHTHGHVHSAPDTMSSVAWMVIMGDGLHNFTDGMAIGAAFAGGIGGGFSTAVAVFCHELPHELGDFAMLLKAGMSMKQALFYNLLSSFLCLFGNCVGVWLGNTENASSWVFAAAAGMFLYIALVDMIPELSSGHETEGTLFQIFLHLGGLLLGFGIMTLIALYEHDLKNIFHEP